MINITIQKGEYWIEEEQRFIDLERDYLLILEHSLVSISKWESEYKKPFMSNDVKTREESIFYIECMTCNKTIPKNVYKVIQDSVIDRVNAYIDDNRTATVITENKREGQSRGLRRGGETITSEKVYSWMILYKIPVEFEKWHFSRLMALIKLLRQAYEESDPNKKKRRLTAQEIMARNNKINAERCKRLGTRG